MEPTKFFLEERDMPKQWYNIPFIPMFTLGHKFTLIRQKMEMTWML